MADIGITKFRVQIPRDGATPSTPGFAQSEGQDPVNPPGSPTGIYVPYLGATEAVNLGEFGLTTGNLIFDTTPTNIPTDQGTMYWDDARQTVALIMNGTTQHVGQDQFIYVKNSSGTSIPKGRNVRNSGTDGGSGHILIEPFLADGTHPSETYLGVTSEEIPNGGFGQVMAFGELDGVNTNSYTAGAFLYVSTSVAGQFQTTAPVAPNNIILVGRAVNSKNNGDIFIRPHIGSNINNDEGVKIVSAATGDLLQLQSGGLWENKTVASVIGTLASKWSDGTNAIYRDGRVAVNTTDAFLVGTGVYSALSVKSKFGQTGHGQTFAVFQDSENFNVLSVTGRNTFTNLLGNWPFVSASHCMRIGPSAPTAQLGLRSFAYQGSADMVRFETTNGTASFVIQESGNILTGFTTSFGVTTGVINAWGTGIRGFGIGDANRFNLIVQRLGGTVDFAVASNGALSFFDGGTMIFGTTTGMKLGTATNQKIGFWNATPIVQPTTAVASATLVGNAGTNITDTDTFDGYTLAQIVKALRNAGLLA